CMQGLEFPWAF
nr:immunoglobulin light chain junction region [Macaca mulatta]MOV35490.1 immunoglobulin light chain junction region [Macaca mulatta]MOV76379.1 immunoglobulin light chain junction region [Macaca mulatta]MOX53932.1 immunoglobulin light chain junction region [Macaca mulatta]MOX55491.1 immunoglobulin light chain junction region [Macaca mulatta]